jgi:hypothetical protein
MSKKKQKYLTQVGEVIMVELKINKYNQLIKDEVSEFCYTPTIYRNSVSLQFFYYNMKNILQVRKNHH